MKADKVEQRLRALLKADSNRRCVNCDSLGPQYVVSSFNVFVCTVCSGVHRQFGHRVKGISMSTFKPEEVAALEASGNGKFAAFFLHKWSSMALSKPVDRDVHRIHTWIAAVYQDRRFYGEPPGGWTPRTSSVSLAGSTTSEGREPTMRQMSEVLGSDTPKLRVQGSSNLEHTVSAVSSTTGATTPSRSATVSASAPNGVVAAAAAPAAAGLNLLDVSSPKSAQQPPASIPAAAAAEAPWDPFGGSSAPGGTTAAPAAGGPAKASPRVAPAPAAEAAWTSFGDAPAQKPPPAAPAASSAPTPPASAVAPAAEGANGWEAFGDGPAAVEPAGAAVPAAAATTVNGSPPKSQAASQPQSKQPVHSTSRPEVPMDVFYPEFEQIRATGMLPTGQPVPLPTFAHSYSAAAAGPGGMAGRPQGSSSYAPYSYPPAQPAYGAAYAAGPTGARPTIAIPPAPLHPGYGFSPAARPGMPSPGYSASSSGYSPAGSGVSPAGSGYSAGPPTANGTYYGAFPGAAGDHVAALRSSTSSLHDLMPGSAAPTPAAHRLGESDANDPFAGLAPGLRGALPAMPNGGSSKYGAAAPPSTPAGMPPFHAAAPKMQAPPATSAPFASPPATVAGLAPATAAASATLFGRAPSLSAYDLSAPAAPKPQATGNPFA